MKNRYYTPYYHEPYYDRPKGCERGCQRGLWIFILAVAVTLLAVCCEKQDEYCWQCHIEQYDKLGTCLPEGKAQNFDMCYKTEGWIRQFERTYTYAICDDSSYMKCKEK